MTAATDVRADRPASYGFGTGRPPGVWLGLGAGPLLVLGVSLLAAVGALAAHVPLLAAVGIVTLATLVAVPTVRGRSLLGWTRLAGSHAAGLAAGLTRWVDRDALADAGRDERARRLRLPIEYGRLRLSGCDDGDVGLLVDRSARLVTAAFTVTGVDRFALLDPAGQDELVAGWGYALAILADADPDLHRLQLLDRATGPVLAASATAESASGVVEQAAVTRQTLLVAGWRHGPRAGAPVTVERCRSVAAGLLAAQLLTRPLGTDELAAALAATFTPQHPHGWAGPLSRRAGWTDVRIADTWHRSYLITGWPAAPVTAGWLLPLLLWTPAAATRTLAVHLHRLSPAEATRVARADRARVQLDRADRARLGLTATARLDRAETSSVTLDDDLAAGHRAHRVAGVITVSAASRAGLDTASGELVQTVAAARLSVAPLHGQHHLGLAATAPACRLTQRASQ